MPLSRNYWTLPGNLHQVQPRNSTLNSEEELLPLLQPETELERSFFDDAQFRQGMLWGEPRYGHPEGKIGLHVREVLDNIELLKTDDEARRRLRIAALVHDTFKFSEHKGVPRDWSKHHAVIARQFLEHYTQDAPLLDLVELHDETYYAWRSIHLYRDPEDGWRRMDLVFERMGAYVDLFYQFFWCDTKTGDKNQMPLIWMEDVLKERL